MGHLCNIIRGLNILRRLSHLKYEKKYAEESYMNIKSHKRIIDRVYEFFTRYVFCGFVKEKFRANLDNKFILWLTLLYHKITTEGTLHNYIFKSTMGFFGGALLTFMLYSFLIISLDLSVFRTYYISVVFSLILPLGLAFSTTVRCVTFATLPQLFTQRGRQALTAFAYILLLTGPTRNTIINVAMFSETLTCSQEQLKAAAKNITESILRPLRSLRATLVSVMKSVGIVIGKVKEGLVYVKDVIVDIVGLIKKAYNWLFGTSSVCNSKLGSAYERCVRAFEEIEQDCRVSIYSTFEFACSVSYLESSVCTIVRPVDYFCTFVSFISDTIFVTLKEKIKEFGRFIKTMFYVSIGFEHSYAFETNQSRTLRQVSKEVIDEVQNRLSFFLFLFHQFSVIFSLYIVYLLISTVVYRYKFLYYDWYDNYFINRYFVELDIRRAVVNQNTLLPLTNYERLSYVSLKSIFLSWHERRILFNDLGFVIRGTFQIAAHLIIDYGVYWVLTIVMKHGRVKFHIGSNSLELEPKGSGFLADLYRIVASVFKPAGIEIHFDTLRCLPNPIPPDYTKYRQIISIMIISWLMVIFQPYGLRLRNHIMSIYYKEAGRRRALWLYNHILQLRGTLFIYLRRQLRRKVSYGVRTDAPSIKKWIFERLPFLWWLFPERMDSRSNCVICGHSSTYDCPSPECLGTYCEDCLNIDDSSVRCALCRSVNDYGDETDFSEDSDLDDDNEDEDLDEEEGDNEEEYEEDLEDEEEEETNGELGNEIILMKPMEKKKREVKRRKKFKKYFGKIDINWAFMEDFERPISNHVAWLIKKSRQ